MNQEKFHFNKCITKMESIDKLREIDINLINQLNDKLNRYY